MYALFEPQYVTDPGCGLGTLTADADAAGLTDLSSELRAVPAPGDVLAVRLYRLLDGRSDADLSFVLAAVRAVVGEPTSDACEDERAAFCRRSLEEARAKLGRIPSRPAYDRWRSAQRNPEAYASATTIRRVLGDGDWSNAVRVLGALAPDVSPRRLLSNGARFSPAECREGALMFFAATPASDRSVKNYRRWARRYSRTPEAKRVPLDPEVIRDRLGANWTELRAEYARATQRVEAPESVETGDAAGC
ncbi:MAG TPA: hypothetical protein VHV75_10285 [Solirubrobacteraceae bacterium]|jgi:hypothetical protein|nr:hypothetical protein [Solirubrobacteraceae bacterium]